jgi:hypothetical protein
MKFSSSPRPMEICPPRQGRCGRTDSASEKRQEIDQRPARKGGVWASFTYELRRSATCVGPSGLLSLFHSSTPSRARLLPDGPSGLEFLSRRQVD